MAPVRIRHDRRLRPNASHVGREPVRRLPRASGAARSAAVSASAAQIARRVVANSPVVPAVDLVPVRDVEVLEAGARAELLAARVLVVPGRRGSTSRSARAATPSSKSTCVRVRGPGRRSSRRYRGFRRRHRPAVQTLARSTVPDQYRRLQGEEGTRYVATNRRRLTGHEAFRTAEAGVVPRGPAAQRRADR